jgi:hypothetical protein
VRLAREVEVKTSTTIALAIATALAGTVAAYAQTDQPTIHHHTHHYYPPHHVVHHHAMAHGPTPAPIAQRPGEPVESGPSQTNEMFKPYANPDGDDDGLSRDPDDCNKGCIGGNPG